MVKSESSGARLLGCEFQLCHLLSIPAQVTSFSYMLVSVSVKWG